MDSFIKYMGGKSQLRKEIIPLIPLHKTYVEPFGGGLWVLFGKPPSQIEFINDIDNNLVNLYIIIKNHLEDFIDYLNNFPISECIFKSWSDWYTGTDHKGIPNTATDGIPKGSAARYGIPFVSSAASNGIPNPDLLDAVRTYYLIMTSFNGNISHKPSLAVGPSRESPIVKFYSTDWDMVRERLKRITILNRDFGAVIEATDSIETFYYLDPPYLIATDNSRYYRYTFTAEDHGRLLVYLSDIKGKFILSYGDSQEIRDNYYKFKISKSLNCPGELLIYNYDLPKKPFYSFCSKGIPFQDLDEYKGIPNGDDIQKVYHNSSNGIPNTPGGRRGSWKYPNCPKCGSRNVKYVWERVSIGNGKRNSVPVGYTCKICGDLFKIEK